MKDFWEELKGHAGLFLGFIFPALGFYAGATNKTAQTTTDALLFGAICMGVLGILVWTPILITTYTAVKQKRKRRQTDNPLINFLEE